MSDRPTITTRTLQREIGQVVNRVIAGEELVITRCGQPVALLVPYRASAASVAAVQAPDVSGVVQCARGDSGAAGGLARPATTTTNHLEGEAAPQAARSPRPALGDDRGSCDHEPPAACDQCRSCGCGQQSATHAGHSTAPVSGEVDSGPDARSTVAATSEGLTALGRREGER